jgi:hypothetical protein
VVGPGNDRQGKGPVDWLALAALGIIWGVLLFPGAGRRDSRSPLRRDMPIEDQEFRHPGRWILSPKRGDRFVGRRERGRQRARERRRRVYLFLLEVIGVTGLIGMFPPLRGMLFVTGFVVFLAAAYTGLVVWARRRPAGSESTALPESDVLVVLPDTAPDRLLEEQDRRVVRIGVR